jgi:hypothetical protein
MSLVESLEKSIQELSRAIPIYLRIFLGLFFRPFLIATALAMGKVRGLSLVRWTAISVVLIILLVGFRDVKGAIKDGYSISIENSLYSLTYIFVLFVASVIVSQILRLMQATRRRSLSRQMFILTVHFSIVIAVLLIVLGFTTGPKLLDTELYEELSPAWVLLYLAIGMDLFLAPLIIALAYFFPFFDQAKRPGSWLGILGAFVGCTILPFAIIVATMAVLQLREIISKWPSPVMKFDAAKAKLTTTSICYSPDEISLKVLANVTNTTGRDLLLYEAHMTVTQNTAVGGYEIEPAKPGEARYLPKREIFTLDASGRSLREVLLTKNERIQVSFTFSGVDLAAALGHAPDKRWMAFYCPIEFDFWYLN